jgi:hypothetical protein
MTSLTVQDIKDINTLLHIATKAMGFEGNVATRAVELAVKLTQMAKEIETDSKPIITRPGNGAPRAEQGAERG